MINFSVSNFTYRDLVVPRVPGPAPEWVNRLDPGACCMIVRFESSVPQPQPDSRIGFLMFGLRSAGAGGEVAWLAESGQPVILATDYLFSGVPDLASIANRNNARPGTARLCAALWRSRFEGPLEAVVRGYF